MGQKNIRVCDYCGKEQEYFGTTEWVVITVARPVFEGQQATTTHDVCDVCNAKLQAFINSL